MLVSVGKKLFATLRTRDAMNLPLDDQAIFEAIKPDITRVEGQTRIQEVETVHALNFIARAKRIVGLAPSEPPDRFRGTAA